MLKEVIYKLKRPYHFVKTGLIKGLSASIIFGFPAKKIKIIGITGTDGKTTTSTLLYHILKNSGKKVALLSTVAAYIKDRRIDTGLHVTTPDSFKLQQLLKEMVKQKVEYLVMEFTSHGAYQYRLFGINPEIVGVTNVSREHYDYHLNYDRYLDAKASIIKKAETVILNKDDISFLKIKKYLKANQHKLVSYGEGTELDPSIKKSIETKFEEKFNQMNARLATVICKHLKINPKIISESIKTFPGIVGRMQFVPTGKQFKVVIDFAHTPQSLESVLKALRKKMKEEKMNGRLIAVYGCAGLRDAGKRPIMGRIGVENADLVVFTAEDPRTESVWSIIRQMKEQLTVGHAKVMSIADRKEAIKFTLTKLAQRGDVVAILGKGHEKSMCYGKTEYAWSDKKVVKKILGK